MLMGIWGNGNIGKRGRQIGQRDLTVLSAGQSKNRAITTVLFFLSLILLPKVVI